MKRLRPGSCVACGAGQQPARQRTLRRHCYDKLWNCWIKCSNREQHSQLSVGPNRWGMISAFRTRAICFLSTRVMCAGAFHLWQAGIPRGLGLGQSSSSQGPKSHYRTLKRRTASTVTSQFTKKKNVWMHTVHTEALLGQLETEPTGPGPMSTVCLCVCMYPDLIKRYRLCRQTHFIPLGQIGPNYVNGHKGKSLFSCNLLYRVNYWQTVAHT